jgi:hypothetical protein
MFEPEEIPQIKAAIQECTQVDSRLLDDLRSEVLEMRPNVRVIHPRTMNSFSLVASESTDNKLVYDPFYFQLIRVVDSNGRNLCLDVVTPSSNTNALSRRQFDDQGEPKTPLGRLMKDLNCNTLNELSPMIPTGAQMLEHPDRISRSWVQVYRDLCEWAVLYTTICYDDFANSTIIVKDGLLRSKIFRFVNGRPLFIEMMNRMQAAIDEVRKNKKIRIYFVGIAKHSQVLTRYSLAMQLEHIFPPGEARYARVPETMEERSYIWKEYMKKVEGEQEERGGEKAKYSVGSLYLVRFGGSNGSPIWAIDLLASQTANDAEILGHLMGDTQHAFPVPHYPACLQKALAFSQIEDFDLDILQDEVIRTVRSILPAEKQEIIDHQVLHKDMLTNRQ